VTNTITLGSDVFTPLERIAHTRGISPDELARTVLGAFVRHADRESSPGLDPAFRQAMADTFRENDDLYRRLAK
jgi:hypothetical protein